MECVGLRGCMRTSRPRGAAGAKRRVLRSSDAMSDPPISEPAHDVLAAEAFAVPAADPRLHPHPLGVPDDPTGPSEPHDILAAEAFPMPASLPAPGVVLTRAEHRRHLGASAALGGVVALALRRLLTRRR